MVVNNQIGRPGDEPDRGTRGIPESGSDVDEARNEVPASSGRPGTNRPAQNPEQPETLRPTQTPDQPETIETPDTGARPPGRGPGENVEFDRNPGMAGHSDSATPGDTAKWGTGVVFMMGGTFFFIIAVIVILWIAL